MRPPKHGCRRSGAIRVFAARQSVLRYAEIDVVAPCPNAAREVGDALVTLLAKELGDALRASTTFAVHHHFPLSIDLGEAVGHIVLRDQLAANLGDLGLPR